MEYEDTDLVVFKELQEEGGDGGGDADEEVDDDEEDVGRAWNLKPEGGRVHDGCDGPPGSGQHGAVRGVHCFTNICSTNLFFLVFAIFHSINIVEIFVFTFLNL